MDNTSWQLETLIKRAFHRTKDRFLSYFLATILTLAIVGAFSFVFIFGGAIVIGLLLGLKVSPVIIMIIGSILFLILFSGMLYFSVWGQLAVVKVVIQEKKLGIIETFKEIKPAIWGFFWFSALSTLFIFGLIPFGIITIFIVLILWSYWSIFSTFVYLDKRKKGLANLWVSREMIDQKFFGIAGRILLINIAVGVLNFLLATSENRVLGLISVILYIFTTPFVMSFSYEMYVNLKDPGEVKTPKAWIILSVVGWVIMIFGISYLFSAMSTYFPTILNNPSIPFMTPPPQMGIPPSI